MSVRALSLLVTVVSVGATTNTRAQVPSAAERGPQVALAVETVVSGGTWSASGAHGRYRVLVVTEGWEEVRHRAFVQRVQEADSPNTPETVRASVDLTAVANLFGLAEPALVTRSGRWYVQLRGADRPMAEYARRLRFELGPPGQVRRIVDQ